MRPPAVALAIAVFGVGATVHGKPAPPEHDRAKAEPSTFWRDIVEPNADEIASLNDKARQAMREPADVEEGDFDWAVEQRARYFVDAYHLMRYARTLAPENLLVLGNLGEAADELGKTREAIDALETAIRIAGPDKASFAITSRLGAIYLRTGKPDQAIRWLRQAQASGVEGAPIVHLAHALAARGEIATAVETLSGALPAQRTSLGGDFAIVAFALAVHYDRDEQQGAAFELLDQLGRSLQQTFGNTIKTELPRLRLPGADEHYYRALLYESLGQYVEARAEWALYAAFPDAPWRARALQHVGRIDDQRRAHPGPRAAGIRGTVPPPMIRHRLPGGP